MMSHAQEQTASQPDLETQQPTSQIDDARKDLDVIRQAIENSTSVPTAAKVNMLNNLQDPLIPAALEDEQVIAKTKLNDARTELDTAQADLKMSKRVEGEQIAAVTAVEVEIEQMEIKVANARQIFQDAEQDHKLLESESKDARLYWDQLKEQHAVALAIAKKSMPLLLRGLVEEDDAKMEDHVEATMKLVTAISKDQGLLAAAPIALRLDGKQRQTYDTVTCDTVQQVVAEHLAQLEGKVAEDKPKERILRAELLGLWALSSCAQEDKYTSTGELSEARKKRKIISGDHVITEERVKQFETKIPKLEEEHAQWEHRIAQLEEACRAVKRTM